MLLRRLSSEVNASACFKFLRLFIASFKRYKATNASESSFIKKAIRLSLLLLLLPVSSLTFAAPADDFVITVNTNNTSDGSYLDTQFAIPTTGNGNYSVDCNDVNPGTNVSALGQTGNYICNYASAGTYKIRISDNTGVGTGFPRILFANAGDKLKIISLDQWGTGKWTSMESAFHGAANMTVPALDTPDFSQVTSTFVMFANASAANPNTTNWNTAAVTNMAFMFSGASAANPNTTNWNTMAVTDMSNMFGFASAANPDTSLWNTIAVTDMSFMFNGASAANPNTTNWDTSAVTGMVNMFRDATSANPITTNWNTMAVTDMERMFSGAISANPDTSLWDVEAVEDMTNMFFGVTLPTASYDTLLTGFNAQSLTPNVNFHGGNSNYCNAAAARANIVNSDGWTISDGGLDCGNNVAPDLQAASDTGYSDSDDVTDVKLPSFDVVCSEAGNTITLYSDNPATNTSIGTHSCNAAATETITATTSFTIGTHNISYTETESGLESVPSVILVLTIVDNILDFDFVMTVKTDNLSIGSSTALQFTIPTSGSSNNYSVDCDAANPGTNVSALGQTGDYTCNYASAGSYTVRIKDNSGMGTGFPRIVFFNSDDKLKVTSLDQWGTGKWTNMSYAFYGASNMVVPAVDTPDFSAVTDMDSMFFGANTANPITTNWNTSAVTNMVNMFRGANAANPDTSLWNVEAVTLMDNMFFGVTLPTASYDALLTGFNAQSLTPNVNFHGGNSKYCNAAAARANMVNSDGWFISDGGLDCTNGIAPDLQAASDSGYFDSDDVTDVKLPSFDVLCTEVGNIITLYSDKPAVNTSIGTHSCIAAATETIIVTTSLASATHNISYTETEMGLESAHSAILVLTIVDNILNIDFVMTVKTDNLSTGSSSNIQFTIPTIGGGYNYSVDCDDANSGTNVSPSNQMGNYTCNYTSVGIYTLRIRDNTGVGTGFPQIFFNNQGDRLKITSLDQWGTGKWANMQSAFVGVSNMLVPALDTPDFSAVTDMSYMFREASAANPNTTNWNTGAVTNMRDMFYNASVANPNTTNWNTSAVTNMSYMFRDASVANPNTINWITTAVIDMRDMFYNASVANPNTTNWNTTAVKNMESMFRDASAANPDTTNWNTEAVTNMNFMFHNASVANPNTANWNTAAVTDMYFMFNGANNANPDTSGWNIEAVTDMHGMFLGVTLPTASYDAMLIGFDAQNLKSGVSFSGGNSNYCNAATARANMISSDTWNIDDGGLDCPPAMPASAPDLQAASDSGILDSDNLTTVMLPSFDVICSNVGNTITLYSDNPAANTSIGTHSCNAAATETITATTSLAIGIHNISYTETKSGLESEHSANLVLVIVDTPLSNDFLITVNTNNLGVSSDTQFTIPTIGGGYNYSVDCNATNPGTNVSPLNQTGNVTCNYASAGIYTLRIKDNTGAGTGFPWIYFNNGGDKLKIISLDQWGTGKWTSMRKAFFGASNMVVPATDTPDFSAVTNMESMFWEASAANPNTTNWDTAMVTNMSGMFAFASAANPNTTNWNTTVVTNMISMFYNAGAANPNTSGWNVEAVTLMNNMFFGVTLPTASYDAMLTGFDAQNLKSNLNFHGGNSTYCNAAGARANMLSVDNWSIADGGLYCPPASPDLLAASDTGVLDSDNVTTLMLPSFDVVCSNVGNTITLYSDNPAANTSIGTHSCIAVATETITATTSLAVGIHNITYTETKLGLELEHSVTLVLEITLIDDKDKDGLSDLEEAALGTSPLDPDTDGDEIEDGLDDMPLISNNVCVGADAIFTTVVTSDTTCAATTSISVESPSEVQAGHLRLIAPLVIFNSGFSAGRLSVKTQDPCASCGP